MADPIVKSALAAPTLSIEEARNILKQPGMKRVLQGVGVTDYAADQYLLWLAQRDPSAFHRQTDVYTKIYSKGLQRCHTFFDDSVQSRFRRIDKCSRYTSSWEKKMLGIGESREECEKKASLAQQQSLDKCLADTQKAYEDQLARAKIDAEGSSHPGSISRFDLDPPEAEIYFWKEEEFKRSMSKLVGIPGRKLIDDALRVALDQKSKTGTSSTAGKKTSE